MSNHVLLLILAFSLLSPAALAIEYHGPVSGAMGGSGRAGVNGSEGAFLNPALLPLVKGFESSLIYRDGDVDVGQHRQGWSAGIVDDSEESYFPGSLHYVQTHETGRAATSVNNQIWHVAGAYLVNNQLSVGASVFRASHAVKNDRNYEQWNGSLGFVYLVNNDFAVAYVLDNIAHPGGKIPAGLREDMQQGIGTFFRFAETATLRADITRRERYNPDHKMAYMLGIESANAKYLVFRAGYRFDDLADQRVWTAGLGFTGPRLRVNYSFEKNQERTSGALHSVDMQVPF